MQRYNFVNLGKNLFWRIEGWFGSWSVIDFIVYLFDLQIIDIIKICLFRNIVSDKLIRIFNQ
jgi:hypothetical protein